MPGSMLSSLSICFSSALVDVNSEFSPCNSRASLSACTSRPKTNYGTAYHYCLWDNYGVSTAADMELRPISSNHSVSNIQIVIELHPTP